MIEDDRTSVLWHCFHCNMVLLAAIVLHAAIVLLCFLVLPWCCHIFSFFHFFSSMPKTGILPSAPLTSNNVNATPAP